MYLIPNSRTFDPRRDASSVAQLHLWIPASAGMTEMFRRILCEATLGLEQS